jgi:hypothetical protein
LNVEVAAGLRAGDRCGREEARCKELTEGEAVVWRERLLAEMCHRGRPAWQKILIVVVIVLVGIFVMRLLSLLADDQTGFGGTDAAVILRAELLR